MAIDDIYGTFGSAVATRRKALDLTQAQLAGRVQMSRASIANIESGRQSVLLHHVYALASALELTKVTDLLPPPSQKSIREELKMTLSSQSLSKQTLSDQAEAQVVGLINSALGPGRKVGTRS
jgi:transcriptional regulator with XRE-family HTH domain